MGSCSVLSACSLCGDVLIHQRDYVDSSSRVPCSFLPGGSDDSQDGSVADLGDDDSTLGSPIRLAVDGGESGGLGRDEVKGLLATVEKVTGEQVKEVTSMIGVSCEGVEKDIKAVFWQDLGEMVDSLG